MQKHDITDQIFWHDVNALKMNEESVIHPIKKFNDRNNTRNTSPPKQTNKAQRCII